MSTPNPSATRASAEKPVLLDAINITSGTLESRLCLYRNLVLAISLVSVASFLTALVCWQPWPLAGLIILVPLTGGFLFLDGRRVSRWRDEIVRLCQTRALDPLTFVDTISRFKHLPAHSLQGMLRTLPAKEAIIPTATHETMSPADTQRRGCDRNADWKTLAGTTVLTLACAGVAGAMFWRSWWLILLTIVCSILFTLLKWK